ncbi:hypothetical protein LPW11_04070 [Geomonas sp. RF6]|uniref:hypothetical protein n=1 Tax=Geomonas sp. RF6 TaxID=2897342 RepID=UPI001E635D2E|nr:hypothetical protein [Geomonas sp. RF6]UFS71375.1 hypothetical protein LPW11_04070 [Geomonas sp. RF6]
MKRTIVSVACLLSLLSMSAPVFAECGWSEGDYIQEEGKYLMADSCTIYGTIEFVNKACNKVKVNVSKITNAFGMRVDATCRYDLGEASVHDVVWMNVKPK